MVLQSWSRKKNRSMNPILRRFLQVNAPVVLVAFLLLQSEATQASELARFLAKTDGSSEYVLRAKGCAKQYEPCKLEVVFMAHHVEKNALELPKKMSFPISSWPLKPPDPHYAEMYLYPPLSESQKWNSPPREVGEAQELNVKSVHLSVDIWGLLVTQDWFGENSEISHSYLVYMVRDGKVAEIWHDNLLNAMTTAGSIGALGAYLPSKASARELFYKMQIDYNYLQQNDDRWTISEYKWDEIKAEVVTDTKQEMPIYAAIIASFSNPKLAMSESRKYYNGLGSISAVFLI